MSNIDDLKYQVSLAVEGIGLGEIKIKTPFDIKPSHIHQIFIERSDDVIKELSIYPNGLVAYFEQYPFQVLMKTNWPIEQESDGSYVIVDPLK